MAGYVSPEMFPKQITLKNEQVKDLFREACNEVGYSLYCCYKYKEDDRGNLTFFYVHDNDGTEKEICVGPYVVNWVASLTGEFNDVVFLPYFAFAAGAWDVDELGTEDYLFDRFTAHLKVLGIVPVKFTSKEWAKNPHYRRMRKII